METGDPTAAQKGTLQMFLPTPTSKRRELKTERGENGVLQSENSSSPRSGFNYRQQPFLLLLFPSWKKARRQAATQVKGSIASSREGSRQWRGDSLQRHTYIHTRTHTCSLRRCRLPHGLVGLLKEAAAPFPLSEMLNTFPLSQQ